MFKKILIANRGEIACRIMRTARRMGILTVAVFSDADRDALHVTMADEAIYIGPPPSRESYLSAQKIIDAAKKTGAEAIHPGYGFLSENVGFSLSCKENGIVFIGPPTSAIEAMGSKSAAKNIMEQASVPLVPGYHGEDQKPSVLQKAANTMGYPVLLKATAGGGGKGMRQVWAQQEFTEALTTAKREALNSFGDDTMLVEKYLTQPRHVEIQVFCDQYNNGVYLAERDCSIQRRHQKVIEEAPAPGITDALRQQMGETAICAAKAINYQGAGTVEFLLDIDGSFYFMEMNTRLQVEHPVTEMITGQDLVEWQLRVANSEELPLTQQQISITGHAIEARIYAEDPANDFLPATGPLTFLQVPGQSDHVRVDTGVIQGDEVSVFYDPMIAKLIVWDKTRSAAIRRLTRALSEYHIGGVTTNINFLYNLVSCAPFERAELDTGFIEKHEDILFNNNQDHVPQGVCLAALYLVLQQAHNNKVTDSPTSDPWSPWNDSSAWRLNEANVNRFELVFAGQLHSVTVEQTGQAKAPYIIHNSSNGASTNQAWGQIEGDTLHAEIDGHRLQATIGEHGTRYTLFTQGKSLQFSLKEVDLGDEEIGEGAAALNAPMNGTIVELVASEGSDVNKGDTLLVMEAMKMEHSICAPGDGKIVEFYFQTGDLVDGGAKLLHFEADTDK